MVTWYPTKTNVMLVVFQLSIFLMHLLVLLALINMVTHFLILLFSSFLFFFFFVGFFWVFFHEHSRFTGQQGKGEAIFLSPLYHFHPLQNT